MIWLPAGGAKSPPSRRDDRPRRALRPDGGQGDLPVRDAGPWPRPRSTAIRTRRPGSPTTSTCSSRTRPTSGSSRRSPRASDLPMDKMFVNLDRYGNTSAASVPIALAEAVDEGRVKVGDKIVHRRVRGRLHVRRGGHRVDGRSGPRRRRRRRRSSPRTSHVRLPVDWDSVDPIPPALAEIMAASPGDRSTCPARRRRARASREAARPSARRSHA